VAPASTKALPRPRGSKRKKVAPGRKNNHACLYILRKIRQRREDLWRADGGEQGRYAIGAATRTHHRDRRIKEKGKEFALPKLGGGKVSAKEVAIFFRQFSVMIDAGLPLVQCLEILAANQENVTFQKR